MKRRNILIIQGMIFLFLMIYFTQISPLLPFDGDDWSYNGSMRLPIPLWGVWNPTRVLPEILSPLCGGIAAFCVYPFTNDYVGAIGIVRSIVLSLFIVTFLFYYFKVLKIRFRLDDKTAIVGECLFLLSFFLFFKHLDQSSYTGFWATDFDCVFFYLVPGLLNATVMFYMLLYKDISNHLNKMSITQRGFFIVILYFALFSNSQFNIILATFSFCELVRLSVFNKFNIFNMSFIRKTYLYLSILLVWIITVVFDLYGRRATSLTSQQSLNKRFEDVYLNLKQLVLVGFNKKVLFISIFLIMIVFLYWIKRADDYSKNFRSTMITAFCCFLLTSTYLVLAYTKAGAFYASRIDAMWPAIFFLLYIFNTCVIYVISISEILKTITPLAMILLAFIAFNFNYLPISSTVDNHDAKTVKAVDNYIIKQVVDADRAGKDKVVVKVPVNTKEHSPQDMASNWPHPYMMALELQNTLYTHRLIRTRIKIIIKPSQSVNKKFYENRKNEQPFFQIEA